MVGWVGRAGPLLNFAGRPGPGQAWAYNLRARRRASAEKMIKHIGLGPGMGLV